MRYMGVNELREKFLSFWVYDRLKVYYKLSGEDNDGE